MENDTTGITNLKYSIFIYFSSSLAWLEDSPSFPIENERGTTTLAVSFFRTLTVELEKIR